MSAQSKLYRKPMNRRLRLKLIEESNYTCFYCGKQAPPTFRLNSFQDRIIAAMFYHIDHYIPLKLRGVESIENYRVACGKCNSQKSALHPTEFYRKQTNG